MAVQTPGTQGGGEVIKIMQCLYFTSSYVI